VSTVVYADNGQGLTPDADILLMVLRELGCRALFPEVSPTGGVADREDVTG
jgi:hypothetical protein